MSPRSNLKRAAPQDTVTDALNAAPSKKTKTSRKPVVKREKATTDVTPVKSQLVPRGARRTAKVGEKDESLLRMLCDDSVTGVARELHFRNIPHSTIDWSDAEHVTKINNWRNQIYGRAGMKSKAVTLWLPDEELWFELYFHLSISESLARGILLPKTLTILASFNRTFVGQILTGTHSPRTERRSNAFASKLNRMCERLRNRLAQCVIGSSGDVFVPKITLELLHAYKELKARMAEKGIVEESEYAENLEEWKHFFSHLPSANDVVVPTTSEEIDVAAIMLSFAQQPVRHQTTPPTAHWPVTPPRSPTSADDYNVVSASSVPSMHRCVTPAYETDISALIASPD